jgi:hypothetical protein
MGSSFLPQWSRFHVQRKEATTLEIQQGNHDGKKLFESPFPIKFWGCARTSMR